MAPNALPLLYEPASVAPPARHSYSVSPATLLQRAEALIALGRLRAARPLVAALDRVGAAEPDRALLRARLALAEQRPLAAESVLDAAIAEAPRHASLRKLRAQVRAARDALADAAQDAAEAIIADPADPQAKALLGASLLALGHPQDAVACLVEAVGTDPICPAYRRALAAAQEATGDVAGAASSLAEGTAFAPRDTALRNAAILLALRRGKPAEGLSIARQARDDRAADACTIGLTGYLLARLGCTEEAADAYRDSLQLLPPAEARAAAYTRGLRVPAPVVRALYDMRAAAYDGVTGGEFARVAHRLCDALSPHLTRNADDRGTLLDLGCGTGFVGVAAAGLGFAAVHGVDASPAMITRARACRMYATLATDDLLAVLARSHDEPPHGAIVAADVLRYFGDLGPVLDAIRSRLRPGGLFAASLELVRDRVSAAPWQLGIYGWFQHTGDDAAAAAAAAGFEIAARLPYTLRDEHGGPVPGLVLVCRRHGA